jgi:hypothetical protein
MTDLETRYRAMLADWRATGAGGELSPLERWERAYAELVADHQDLAARGLWESGRSDLLGILGRGRREVDHTTILGWLLDPAADLSMRALHVVDPYAAADFGAWVLGDLLTRVNAATIGPEVRGEVALSCTSLYEAFERLEEGIYMPYLVDGFKATRETGGQELFARWSNAML